MQYIAIAMFSFGLGAQMTFFVCDKEINRLKAEFEKAKIELQKP